MTGTYDPQLDTVYWPVGNPGPDLIGDDRGGDNLYTDSVVALDAKTGKLKWHFQFTPHDVWDWDAAGNAGARRCDVAGPAAQAAGAGQSQRIFLRARSHERQVPLRQAVRRRT